MYNIEVTDYLNNYINNKICIIRLINKNYHNYNQSMTILTGDVIMDLLNLLIYKEDKVTGIKRVSKTKLISLIVFIAFFILSFSMYFTNPELKGFNIMVVILGSIIFASIFAIPTFVVGFLIGKFIIKDNSNRNTSSKYNHRTIDTNQSFSKLDINQNNIQNINSRDNTMRVKECPHDNAKQFKSAIEENDADAANNILSKWDVNDANQRYASIIFEGMPPSDMTISQLNEWLQIADNMSACDNSLKEWYRSTAMEVINLHNQNN